MARGRGSTAAVVVREQPPPASTTTHVQSSFKRFWTTMMSLCDFPCRHEGKEVLRLQLCCCRVFWPPSSCVGL